ncbi:MAG: mannose-1-phosphate guanylyltransferase [Planctomycetota bacterium]|jgi:mannose-1-phosphate guanylyltransferase
MLYSVIMAGGSGTRFWPLSRRAMPKQAMSFVGGESLFQRAVARIEDLAPPERTFVITNAEQAALLASQAPRVPRENIVAEPVARDSAAAVFLAASIIAARDAEAVMLVKTADHIISPVELFHATVRRAAAVAEKGHLVTFGVKPGYPATGYGYVERGEPLESAEGAFQVRRFTEKPDAETAEGYIADGKHYWNSGMFVWQAGAVLAAAERFAPAHYEAISPLGAHFGAADFGDRLVEAYEPLEKISIDYAVMEKAPNVAMVEADFDWDDVGSPVSFRDYFEPDDDNNVLQGMTVAHESSDCILVSDEEHIVAAVGLRDVVVIHTDDATIVCPASKIADVKGLVSGLASDERTAKYV